MTEKTALQSGAVLRGKKEYTITSVLGMGGYGITYLAQNIQQGHNIPDQYAIKEFFFPKCCKRNADGSVTMQDAATKSAKEYEKAFKVEAEHLMNLNQISGIVHVQEIFEDNGTVYYVMEHLGDTSLSKLIKTPGSMPDEALSMRITKLVGQSLAMLHQKKMNHLDVNPDNIMLVGEGMNMRPVLIDFGLSRHYNYMGKAINDYGVIGYSEGYAPAEQYVGIEAFAPTADIYALAATLFEMLTGHAPEIAPKLTEDYLRNELNGKTSDERVDAIVHAMERNPKDRTQSINEFLSELGLNDSPANSGRKTVDISRSRKKSNINWVYVAGFAVIVALGAGLGIALSGGGSKPEKNVIAVADTIKKDTINPVQAPETKELAQAEEVKEVTEQKVTQTETRQDAPVKETKPKQEREEAGPSTVNLGYAKWQGETRGGKPYGLGTMTYTSDHLVDSRDANGTYAAAGDRMKGEFRNGHWEYGTLYSASGSVKAKISIGAD